MILIALAIVIWWIARDMVSINRTLNDAARIRIEISEDVAVNWRLVSPEVMPVTIEVSGPSKEINKFASELEANPGRYGYHFTVTDAEIAGLPVSPRHQVTLTIDMTRIADNAQGVLPAELRVTPMAGERVYQITLERYVSREAWIDLETAITGRVTGYDYQRRVQGAFPVEVHGPAGQIDDMTGPDGRARVQVVTTDVAELLESRARLEDREIAAILREDGYIISNLPLITIEGVDVRRVDTGAQVRQIPVEITFAALQSYVEVRGQFPVAVQLPGWLIQRGARVRGIPAEQTVEMEILSNQRQNFTRDNLKVVLDLSEITPADVEIEAVEGTGLRRAKASLLFYSLVINRERLTYRFKNPDVTAQRYIPIAEVSIEWTE